MPPAPARHHPPARRARHHLFYPRRRGRRRVEALRNPHRLRLPGPLSERSPTKGIAEPVAALEARACHRRELGVRRAECDARRQVRAAPCRRRGGRYMAATGGPCASSCGTARRPPAPRRRHRRSTRRRRPRRPRRRGRAMPRRRSTGSPRRSPAPLVEQGDLSGERLLAAGPDADRRARPAPRHRPEVGPADRLPPAQDPRRRRHPAGRGDHARPRPRCASAHRCFNVTDAELCSFCRDDRRDARVVCVVEESRDIVAVERTGEFHGRYHVLLGAMSPLEGIGPEQLKIRELLAASSRRASRR